MSDSENTENQGSGDGAADQADNATANATNDQALAAAQADIVTADPGPESSDYRAEAMAEAQASQEQAAAEMVAAREFTDPSATYSRGVPGANVNVAAPADAPVISTYADALEAGYFGVAPGHANTDKMSVAAVSERDRKLGLPGTKGLDGAVVNGAGGTEAATEDGDTSKRTARRGAASRK